MRRPWWLLALLVVIALAPRRAAADASTGGPINAVIGDAGIAGVDPAAGEDDRLAAHLAYVEATLRRADVSMLDPVRVRARANNLDRLARYREARQFPHNTYRAGRVPVFVDATGRRCAVAALAEADLGARAIEAIAATDRLAYLGDIASPTLARWAAGSGLTLRELAMIQPTYHFQQRGVNYRSVGQVATLAAAELCAITAYPKTIAPLPPPGAWLNATLVLDKDGVRSINVDPVTPTTGELPPSWTASELESCLLRQLKLAIPALPLSSSKTVKVAFQTPELATADKGLAVDVALHVAATRLASSFTKCQGKGAIEIPVDVDHGKVTLGKLATAQARCVAKQLGAITFPSAAPTHLDIVVRREVYTAGVMRDARISIARMLAQGRDNPPEDPEAGGE